ncbi:MAG: helix-turn-helix transcriptional regulator [Burkholderiaceae bacterium]|nr:helix-turn-helix transcriptional regulator [Burkholderiaceae bacterium]
MTARARSRETLVEAGNVDAAVATAMAQLEVAMERLGRDLALARRRRRIAQREMARRARMSLSTLHRLERGDVRVSLDVLARVCLVLGFHPAWAGLMEPFEARALMADAARPATGGECEWEFNDP